MRLMSAIHPSQTTAGADNRRSSAPPVDRLPSEMPEERWAARSPDIAARGRCRGGERLCPHKAVFSKCRSRHADASVRRGDQKRLPAGLLLIRRTRTPERRGSCTRFLELAALLRPGSVLRQEEIAIVPFDH